MEEKLYIIGNGFDLHHHMKTSYYDFANYLKTNDKRLYSELESYISYPNTEKDLWSKFEENLANLDTDEILTEHSDYLPNYSSDEFRDRDRYAFPDLMEQIFENLTAHLFERFSFFIQQVEMPNSSEHLKLEIDNNSIFLTFNYTNTLEKLYNVKRENILYIHNSAIYGSEDIILGHAIDPKTFEEERPEPPVDIEPEDYEKWYRDHDNYDYSYTTGKESLMKYFEATFKPTKDIILHNSTFFENVKSFKEIIILGHSLSAVDLPYIKEIFKYANSNAEWKVSYYSCDEGMRHKDTLTLIGIQNLTLFELIDIQKNNRQLKIEFK